MSMDLLVSENESSSDESLPNATQVSGRASELDPKKTESESERPLELRQEEYQNSLSSGDEEEEESNEPTMSESPLLGTANIKNEMLKSKITTSASVMLTRLPPDSTKVIKKLTEETNEKITIRCQAIGSAPQLSPMMFKISDTQPFATLIKFINKKLKKKLANKEDVIYCYVNNSFAPSPDEVIGNLHKHFAKNNELVVSYCNVVAFG